MIILPDNTRDIAEVHTFFEGIRVGIQMAKDSVGRHVSFKKEAVTHADIASDTYIFEKQMVKLFSPARDD